jgi:hypothetical protein
LPPSGLLHRRRSSREIRKKSLPVAAVCRYSAPLEAGTAMRFPEPGSRGAVQFNGKLELRLSGMPTLWMLPALVGAMLCALLAQYVAARALIRFGVPLIREVEIGRVGDEPVIQHQRTPVSIAVDVVAYGSGLAGGWFGIVYLIQLLSG